MFAGLPKPSPRRAAAVAVVLGASLAASACGSTTSPTTLRLESQLSSTKSVFITPGQSLGQELIFTAMLYPPGAPAATGRSQGTCLRAEPGDGEVYNCELTFILPAGTIYALALSSHDGPASGIVAGGTGSYKNARGSFLYVSTGKPRISLTLALTS